MAGLTGQGAIITGGKRIGAAVALALAGRGMQIALSYNRSQEEAQRAADTIQANGGRAFIYQTDLSRADAVRAFVDRAAADLGSVNALIHMASVYSSVTFDELDERAWDAVMNVDLKAAFLCARAAVPHMRARGGGRIITFTDWVARSGRPRYKGYLPYYVAKHGVVGLTEALALELAEDHILVNAIAPGPILAPPETTDEEYRAVEAATPLGRWGGEAEIVAAVIFLLETEFMTGETIRIDGGRHLK